MIVSQNGWEANNRNLIHNPELDDTGVTFPGGIRKGDVTVLLFYVARRFNNEIERLVPGWCWGYAEREVRGGTSLSNHASGTALDFNAPKHPLGSEGTFNTQQVISIHRIIEATQRTVRWGGDYSGRRDEMHFEINADADRVSEIAQQLGDDMPLTNEDVKKIWNYVIDDHDGRFPAPWPGGPAWMTIGDMFHHIRRIMTKLHEYDRKALDVNVDPAVLAEAIVEVLPENLASEVAEEIGRRLSVTDTAG